MWEIPGLEVHDDLGPAAWLRNRFAPRHDCVVHSWSPTEYPAYTRIFFPVFAQGRLRSWTDVAIERGLTPHPAMTESAIFGVDDRTRDAIGDPQGYLPRQQLAPLVALLSQHTATPERSWLCLWEGLGDVVASSRPQPGEPPRLELEWRTYLLYSGDGAAPLALLDADRRYLPDIWWPDDRSWVFTTDCDFSWGYLASTPELRQALVTSAVVEAMPVEPTDVAAWRWDDPLNGG